MGCKIPPLDYTSDKVRVIITIHSSVVKSLLFCR